MKLIMPLLFLGWISINDACCQNQKIILTGKSPLLRGYFEYIEPANGFYISRPSFITLISDCDSVFSTETGTIISVSESPKDTSQKLIIKSRKLKLFFYGLKQLNVKKGDKIAMGQFLGFAKQIGDKRYSIKVQGGDKKTFVWGREKLEKYLNLNL